MSQYKFALTKSGVLLIAIAAFFIPIILIEVGVLQFTGGIWSYPIDDTCIHLAIANNIAHHGVWGVSPTEFVSASSSVLYPLVLAFTVKIFGTGLILPFVINVLAAIALILVVQRWLEKQEISYAAQLWVLIAFIYLTPLPALAMIGMEHIFHLLFTFLFITAFCDQLGRLIRTQAKEWTLPWPVFVYGALMTASRYEGLFIIAICGLILLIHRRIFIALQLGIFCALPILVFGFYSISKGNYFVPNSVLLKSGAPPLTFDGLYEFFTQGLFMKLFYSVVGYNTVAVQRLLFMLPIAFLLFTKQIRENVSYKYMLIIFLIAVFMHLSLTGYARFPRYEAYIIGCGVVFLGMLVAKYGQTFFTGKSSLTLGITWLMVIFLVLPMGLRSIDAFDQVGKGCVSFYELQYQMGQFMRTYYPTQPMAIGDIGAVSYYSTGKKLDLVGLGDIEVARSRKGNYNSAAFIESLTKRDNVKMAIVTEYYTDPNLLRKWTRIATWQPPDYYGGNIVSFFAIDKDEAPALRKYLKDYQKNLPPSEIVHFYREDNQNMVEQETSLK